MADYKKLLGTAIANRMKNSGFFDDILGGSGSDLYVEYQQQEFNEIQGPLGKCTIFPEADDLLGKAGGASRGDLLFTLEFYLNDLTGQGFQVTELFKSMSKAFLDEDRAVLVTEFAALETDGDWLGRSGEVILEPVPYDKEELRDRPEISVGLRFEGMTWKSQLT